MPPQARHLTRWISKDFPEPFAVHGLQTSDTILAELLSSFQLYSEVKALGYEILRQNNHPNLKVSHSRFQSYIRQGIAFNQAASNLHFRASPLLYYYSFMNFAKSVIFLRDPAFTAGHIHHGLTPSQAVGGIKRHFVTARHGVFSQLYRQIIGQAIPNNTRLNVVTLLGYVSDVALNSVTWVWGSPRAIRAQFAVAQSAAEQGFRGIIAAASYPVQSVQDQLRRILRNHFDQITLSPSSARIFNLSAEEARPYVFWETKSLFPVLQGGGFDMRGLLNAVHQGLAGYLCREPFAGPFLFSINFKMRTPAEIAMNECLAIYAVMFYLGSLVRYRPELMEGMLVKKDAWIVENFIRSSPTTFLRHLRNRLDPYYFIYEPR